MARAVACWLASCLCALLARPAQARDLVFQAAGSDAAFDVRLIWFQTVSGHFRDMQGSVHVDPADGLARVDARIRVDSVVVHPAHYRKRLLGSHFFDARRFPDIHFQSDPLSLDALRNGVQLQGRLTLHGVTHPLTLELSETRCRGAGLDGCTLHLRGSLDRTRYGMHAYRALVSRHVRLNLKIRLQAEPDPAPAAASSRLSR